MLMRKNSCASVACANEACAKLHAHVYMRKCRSASDTCANKAAQMIHAQMYVRKRGQPKYLHSYDSPSNFHVNESLRYARFHVMNL